MSELFQTVMENLPDVWFDWYARLIPGCFGVALYLYLSARIPPVPDGIDIVLFLLFGYVLGHILQPAVGIVVKGIERLYGNEQVYAEAKKGSAVRSSSLKLVSKAHAEANSMLALSVALLLNTFWFWNSPRLNKRIAIPCAIYFALAAVARTYGRNRKIEDLK